MKEILISIKPKWCELIASGKKTIGKTDFNVDILCWVDMEDAGAYIEIIGNIYEKS